MTTNTIENFAGSDIIDVRDIIARVEELRHEMQGEIPDGTTWKGTEQEEECTALESLLSDLCDNGCDEQWEGDWYPVTLIRKSHFEKGMDEMIADCYPDLYKCIPCFVTVTLDYEMLKQDYTECEFEGDTYYYR